MKEKSIWYAFDITIRNEDAISINTEDQPSELIIDIREIKALYSWINDEKQECVTIHTDHADYTILMSLHELISILKKHGIIDSIHDTTNQ